MQSEINELKAGKNKFIYKNKCLVKDFHESDCCSWALECAKWLFTEDELIANCVYITNKSTRGALDKERVKLLHGKYYFLILNIRKHAY